MKRVLAVARELRCRREGPVARSFARCGRDVERGVTHVIAIATLDNAYWSRTQLPLREAHPVRGQTEAPSGSRGRCRSPDGCLEFQRCRCEVGKVGAGRKRNRRGRSVPPTSRSPSTWIVGAPALGRLTLSPGFRDASRRERVRSCGVRLGRHSSSRRAQGRRCRSCRGRERERWIAAARIPETRGDHSGRRRWQSKHVGRLDEGWGRLSRIDRDLVIGRGSS